MRTKRQQRVSLSWYQSAAIYVGLQLSTLCGRATLSLCSRHNSWSLTLFSVNRWQVALVFFMAATIGLVSQWEGVCQPRKCILYSRWALLSLRHALEEMHFDGKKLLDALSPFVFYLLLFSPTLFSPPPFISPNLPFHFFYCHSQTLQVCGHLMLDFPFPFLSQEFMTAIKSVLHVPPPDQAHATF